MYREGILLKQHVGTYMSDMDVFNLEDARRLELGLSIRERIMVELTKDGKLPHDTSSREFLLRAIEGVDAVVLKKAKLKNEDKNRELQEQTSNNIAELLKRVTVTKSSYDTVPSTTLDSSIKVDNVVPGETEIGMSNEQLKTEVLGIPKD